ncbi:MAG: cytochrome c-type biogenesis protein CcmF, partial [Myxococcota bacterium]
MQPLGSLLLHIAFFTTLATALVAIFGAMTRREAVVTGARYGVYANAFLYLAMAGILWHGYFTHDFANKYVASYSDVEMPLIYLFTSFWGGEKGALLFWGTVLCVFSAIAVHQARDKDISYLGWASAILMLAVFFYDILMVFESNPFESFLTHAGPRDGEGLNPLLQNPTMAIHPPSLLTGYIAFTLPFAFGAASLITGRLDDQWAKDTRKWTLVSWVFLTTGLVLGGAWAYEELGWGGFWMWDPVENAGLIPWFTATAFLHSIVIQERRGMLRRWNFTLVCMTFFLTIFGTFLTRSQLIVSIHAFADSQLSNYFLWYMAVIGVTAVCLLGWRWPQLRSPERIESFLSREAFFVLNNVMLCMCAFIIIWGTLYSKSNEFAALFIAMATNFSVNIGDFAVGQDLGEPWFNKVMVPAGVVLLGLTAVGPLIAWRRTTWRTFNKTFVGPLALSAAPMLLGTLAYVYYRCALFAKVAHGSLTDGYNLWSLTLDPSDIYAFFGIYFSLFTFTGVAMEFIKGGRVRQRSRGGGLGGNIWELTLKAKRRYGGYIVHLGVALAFLGFAGVAFKKEAPETPLHLGDSLKVGNYNLTYVQMQDVHPGEGFI